MKLPLTNESLANEKLVVLDAKFIGISSTNEGSVIDVIKDEIYGSFRTTVFQNCFSTKKIISFNSSGSIFEFTKCCFDKLNATQRTFQIDGTTTTQNHLSLTLSSYTNCFSGNENTRFLFCSFHCSNMNSSFDTSKSHGVLYTRCAVETLLSFTNFYGNEQDILYICNNINEYNTFVKSNIVNNSKSNGRCGLVHTNDNSCTLTCRYLVFSQNSHTILNAMKGKIIVMDSFADSWQYTDTIPSFLRTGNLGSIKTTISSLVKAECYVSRITKCVQIRKYFSLMNSFLVIIFLH